MTRVLTAAALAAVLGMGGAAFAADLSAGGSVKDVVYEPVMSWTGFYAGVSGGIGFASPQLSDPAGDSCYSGATCQNSTTGGLAGATLGYNKQFSNWVIGAEGDISWARLNADKTNYAAFGFDQAWKSDIDAMDTLRLRAGYAAGSNLFYLTGGAAFVDARHQATLYSLGGGGCRSFFAFCDSGWHTGFVIGGGYEAMLTGRLSFKAEYLYISTKTDTRPDPSDSIPSTLGFTDNLQIARVGLNYKLIGDYVPLK